MTFVDHLSRYAQKDWAGAIETLHPQIHPVDLNATRVWFAFFPKGPRADEIESSHTFLYGHRYWPQVKRAILAAAKDTTWPSALSELCEAIADHSTRTTQVDRDQLLGITAASLLSLRTLGLDAFVASSGTVQLPSWSHVRSIRQVRRARAHQHWQWFGRRRWRMTYSEAVPDASCDVVAGNTIASGLPPELKACRAGCTGKCVIGCLDGAQYLSPIAHEEQALLAASGVGQPASDDGYPLIRLACHARPAGDVSFVLCPT